MNIFEDIFMRNFEIKKNNVAIVATSRTLTYGSLLDEIYTTQEIYKEYGIKAGSRIMVFMENCPEFTVSFMALNLCGAVIIPVYVKLGALKLKSIINFYEPNYIVTNEKNYPGLMDLQLSHTEFVSGIFVHDDTGKVSIREMGKRNESTMDENIAIILSTSGTTSEPKGIMLSNDNIVSNTASIARYMGVSGADRILMVKSINHSSSITGELLVGLYAGCTIYIYSGIMHSKVLVDSLMTNKISVFYAVPSILKDLLRREEFEEAYLPNLRIIHFYGSVMNDCDMEELLSRFDRCEIIYSYGLTEAAPRVTYAKKDRLLKYKGTSGIALPGVAIRIDSGEIVVKGPNVMCGYFKNSELTEKVLRNGELYTGDLGEIDEVGNLYVMGRKDNMIIKNGRNVFPEEVERCISQLGDVSEVLVVGTDDKIIAYVVSDRETINEKELIKYCRINLEDYKVPDKIIKIPELLKNANNKVLRNVKY